MTIGPIAENDRGRVAGPEAGGSGRRGAEDAGPCWHWAKAGTAYFGLVFGAGFLLGPLRILLLEPRVGARWAELAELPLMVIVMVLACRWILRRGRLPRAAGPRLGMGAVALAFMLAAEFGLVLALRGITVAEYFATRDPVSGAAYYLSLALFALLPWLSGRLSAPPHP